jgi:hypothetical protein
VQGGQAHDEAGAVGLDLCEGHVAAMGLGDGAHDRQAEAEGPTDRAVPSGRIAVDTRISVPGGVWRRAFSSRLIARR